MSSDAAEPQGTISLASSMQQMHVGNQPERRGDVFRPYEGLASEEGLEAVRTSISDNVPCMPDQQLYSI